MSARQPYDIILDHATPCALPARRCRRRRGERAIAVSNPYTGAPIGTVPKATLDEVRAVCHRPCLQPELTPL
jgi:hypothetical protein